MAALSPVRMMRAMVFEDRRHAGRELAAQLALLAEAGTRVPRAEKSSRERHEVGG